MKVDFYKHNLSSQNADAIARVLDTPFLTSGSVGKEVESQLCDYFNTPYALLVNSWTNGALATLLAMGVGPGDEVIVPAQTFVASANVVEVLGAKTVLVDVDAQTLLMRPETAAAAVTAKTKAIIPVHLYGRMVDISALRQALDASSQPGQYVYILEDCAHGIQRRHASRRRNDPDAGGKTIPHDIRKARMQFCVNRFAWQKHDRTICGFTFDDVSFGDVLDVFADRNCKVPKRRLLGVLRFSAHELFVGLKRKFGINHDRPRRIWQVHKAVCPSSIRQGRLQGVAVAWQRLRDDIRQLYLTKCSAGLLV